MHNLNIVFKKYSFLLFFILLFDSCSGLPKTYLEQQQLTPDERVIFNQKVFDSAWKRVNTVYYDQTFNGKDWVLLGDKYRDEAVSAADTDKLYEVINKMLAELEVSHLFARRNARKDITDSSKKKGAIGLIATIVQEKIYISTVLPDSPASKAGVQKGWLLVGRNGVKFSDSKNADLYTIAGEAVTFDFLDQYDHPRSLRIIPVKPDKIQLVEAHELNNGFLYLKMPSFGKQSVNLLRKKLEEYSDTRGLVFDLRSNTGGSSYYKRVAVGHFFPDNIEMGTYVTRKGKEIEEESVDFLAFNYDKPMVILVNSISLSAAEIFTHILQFHHRATVIGQKTAGAVLTAQTFNLPDGGEIMVPKNDYIGLNGERLEGAGVVPDIELPEATLDELRAGKDRDLEIALEILSDN